MLWCKRGEAVEKRRGGGGVLFESRPWYAWKAETWRSTHHPVRTPDYIKGQIGGFVLQYINFTMGADLTISVR